MARDLTKYILDAHRRRFCLLLMLVPIESFDKKRNFKFVVW